MCDTQLGKGWHTSSAVRAEARLIGGGHGRSRHDKGKCFELHGFDVLLPCNCVDLISLVVIAQVDLESSYTPSRYLMCRTSSRFRDGPK